jgi:hypothetical protein
MLVTRLTIDAQSGGLMPPAGHIKICFQATCFQGYLPADGTNAAVHWRDYGRPRWQLFDKITTIAGFHVRAFLFFCSSLQRGRGLLAHHDMSALGESRRSRAGCADQGAPNHAAHLVPVFVPRDRNIVIALYVASVCGRTHAA